MEKADISTLEKPDISILVLQSDLSFGYLSAEFKSPPRGFPLPSPWFDISFLIGTVGKKGACFSYALPDSESEMGWTCADSKLTKSPAVAF
jgi:hypothetical protein